MQKSLFAIALMATGAACNAPATKQADTAEATTEQAATEVKLYKDLGGEPSGPVYRKAKEDTLAVSGFDVVSYFTGEGVPVEGSEEFTVRYQGFDYRFASKENADKFVAEPAKYAPQYGGYCAWAIGANDALAPTDPMVYAIRDGKLYLNFSKDVQAKWEKDQPGFIAKGDKNYPTHKPTEHYQD
jgi:YHS domain-containing protein